MTTQELLEQVMLKDPLYKTRSKSGHVYKEDLVSLRPINFYCVTCLSEQTFELAELDNEHYSKAGHSWQQHSRLSAGAMISGRGLDPSPVGNSTRHITFRCAKCKAYTIHFYVAFTGDRKSVKGKEDEIKTAIQKVGQLPPFESTIDTTIEKWLSKTDQNLYMKGLRSEAHGFGIGSFSYFRRIVENNAQKILEGVSESTDSDELKLAIAEALKKHTATERLELVKDHAPTSFAVDGQNVFTILYGALSSGIHGKSDEDCLSIATSIRVCLNFLIQKIAATKQEKDVLKEALKDIA
jgi:hypothetical protein